MIRWQATTDPQHTLPAMASLPSPIRYRGSNQHTDKPAPREAPPSA